jgi:hypothetical protein
LSKSSARGTLYVTDLRSQVGHVLTSLGCGDGS